MVDPDIFWLQLGNDASHEMIGGFIVSGTFGESVPVEYRPQGTSTWLTQPSISAIHPTSTTRRIHHVLFTGLAPDTFYEYRHLPTGTIRRFMTLPTTLAGGRTIRAAIGSDGMSSSRMNEASARVGSHTPDFIFFVGDWCDSVKVASTWDSMLSTRMAPAFRIGDRVIPLIPAIGNHEFDSSLGEGRVGAPIFYALFRFPIEHQGAYQEHRAGSWLSVVTADSEHSTGTLTNTHPQTLWLHATLQDNASIQHRIVGHHASHYPAHRSQHLRLATAGRNFLAPAYEAGNIKIAFMGHDHVYGRTHPIKAGAVNADGVRYFGQGAWSSEVRGHPTTGIPENAHQWYVDEAWGLDDPVKGWHFHIVDFTDTECTIRAFGSDNTAFHTFVHPVQASVAQQGFSLSWVDTSTNEDDFLVERSLGTSDQWSIVGIVPGAPSTGQTVTFTGSFSLDGVQRRWRVRARNAAGVSAPSNTVTHG
jgi:hypothetical protein